MSKEIPIPVIRRENLSESVAREIESLVLQQYLKPGEKLPSERELAQRFRVGRYALREGLRTLQAKGLIKVIPGKGIFVSSTSTQDLVNALTSMFILEKESLEELIETRRLIESDAARLAAERADQQDLKTMEESLELLRLAGTQREKLNAADELFHFSIAYATHNVIFEKITKAVRHAMSKAVQKRILDISEMLNLNSSGIRTPYTEEFCEQNFQYHYAIYEAIRNRKPDEAYDTMSRHISEGILIRYLERKLKERSGDVSNPVIPAG